MYPLGRQKYLIKVVRWSIKEVDFSGRGGGREWNQEGPCMGNSTAFGTCYFLSWMVGSPVFVFTELYAFYMSEIFYHTPKTEWALHADGLECKTSPVLCYCVSSVFSSVKWGPSYPPLAPSTLLRIQQGYV